MPLQLPVMLLTVQRLLLLTLTGASFFSALAEGANFSGANMTLADLESGNFEDADFTNAVLAGAFVNNAQLKVRSLLCIAVSGEMCVDKVYSSEFASLSTADPRTGTVLSLESPLASQSFTFLVLCRADTPVHQRFRLPPVLLSMLPLHCICPLLQGARITGTDWSDVVLRKDQQMFLCKLADGTNPTTGVDTKESLLCP